MSTLFVYGKYLIPDAGTTIPSGAVFVRDGKVEEIGQYKDLIQKFKPDILLGDSEALVTPGLVNAHGHGRGISDFQRGAIDDTLEVWKFRRYPPISAYWDTLWQCVLLLESGVTAVMHNHTPVKPLSAVEEMEEILNSYKRSGLRLAFAPALSYVNTFVYGEQEAFLSTLSTEDRKLAEQMMQHSRLFTPGKYFDTVDTLTRSHDSNFIRIHHGPMAPQWIEEEVLVEIEQRARKAGKMLFTHVQQTPQQYLYGLKTYGKTLIAWMEEKGILGPHVSLGHCVWITEEDIQVLARTRCNVTHHPSCNLRVRNGISPLWDLHAAGVSVGLGMDDKEFGDDRDFIEEMRMASKLHRVVDLVPGSPCLGSRDVFRMATEGGAQCIGWGDTLGKIEVGKPADLVVLDYSRMTEPFTYSEHDPVEVLLQRGRKSHVRHVVVGGEVILKNGIVTKIDKEEVLAKLKESIPGDYTEQFQQSQKNLSSLKQSISRWFAERERELDPYLRDPFYRMNNRNTKL